MSEGQPQDLGECEDEMPVGDGADHLFPDEFGPQGGAFGRTGRAEPRYLQEKATRYSFSPTSHRTRAKPPSGRPHEPIRRFRPLTGTVILYGHDLQKIESTASSTDICVPHATMHNSCTTSHILIL
jgi:hypothetical protein